MSSNGTAANGKKKTKMNHIFLKLNNNYFLGVNATTNADFSSFALNGFNYGYPFAAGVAGLHAGVHPLPGLGFPNGVLHPNGVPAAAAPLKNVVININQ